jgi:serine O-acetyltransferase
MAMLSLVKNLVRRQTHMLALYRLRRWLVLRGGSPGRALSSLLGQFALLWTNCQISPYCELGRNVRFPHPIGIVIGEGVSAQDDVMIWQHVTIGSHGRRMEAKEYPVIERRTRIYAGAVVVGGGRVGQNSIVGANSMVTKDVPDGATVVGSPARVLDQSPA